METLQKSAKKTAVANWFTGAPGAWDLAIAQRPNRWRDPVSALARPLLSYGASTKEEIGGRLQQTGSGGPMTALAGRDVLELPVREEQPLLICHRQACKPSDTCHSNQQWRRASSHGVDDEALVSRGGGVAVARAWRAVGGAVPSGEHVASLGGGARGDWRPVRALGGGDYEQNKHCLGTGNEIADRNGRSLSNKKGHCSHRRSRRTRQRTSRSCRWRRSQCPEHRPD